MTEPKKRFIRLFKAPWLNLHRHLRHKTGRLRLTRRRRQWGFVLLGIMVGLIGLFFYLINPSNLRISAQEYFQQLVNGKVEVSKASFSFGQGIKLGEIRIFANEQTSRQEPVFKADSVNLRISFAALLHGRLAATHITAFHPQVYLVEAADGHWNCESLFIGKDIKPVHPLPSIVLRQGQIHYAEEIGGKAIHGGTFDLTARFEPSDSQKQGYWGQVEITHANQRIAQIKGQFDTASGTFSELAAGISLTQTVRQSLPRRVRDWMNEYNLSGQLSASGQYGSETQTKIIANLQGVNIRLPINEQLCIDISDAQGQLQFTDEGIFLGTTPTDEHAKTEPVRLSALGAQWQIAGRFHSYKPQANFDLDISCPKVALPKDPQLISSLPQVHRTIFKDWKPTGFITLECNVNRKADNHPSIQASGYVRCLDVAGIFRHFPYHLENISGLIRFDSKKTILENFRVEHRSKKHPGRVATLIGSGQIQAPYENARADILVTCDKIFLDDELRAALQHKDKVQWDKFELSGTASLSCRLVHRPEKPKEWIAYIESELISVKAKPSELPYPLSDLHGRVYISPDKVEIGRPHKKSNTPSDEGEFVSGRAGKAQIQLQGLVRGLGRANESINLNVRAKGLQFDEVLANALPPQARELYDILNPSGLADIRGTIITSKAKSEEPNFLIDVWPTKAACKHKDFPYPLEQVAGHVRLSPGKFELLEFTAKQGQASFNGQGTIATRDNKHYQADLTINAQDVPLDDILYNALKPDQQQTWDKLQPVGKCNAELRIINDPGDLLSYRVRVLPQQVQITYKPLPYTLNNLTGELILAPDLATVDIRGTDPPIAITGNIKIYQQEHSSKLVVTVDDLALDEKLRIVLPENLKQLWQSFEPSGKVDIQIDSLNHVLDKSHQERLALQGTLALKGLDLKKPIPCRGLSGLISGSMQSGPDGLQVILQGELALPELALGKIHLKNLSGTFTKGSRNSNRWSISNIRADLADGQLAGHIKSDKDANGSYTALLQAEGVDLAKLLAHLKSRNPRTLTEDNPSDSPEVQGRLKASLSLEGKLNEPASTGGRGRIFIDKAQLYKLPVMIQVMQTLSLQPVKTNAFETVEIDFYLQGQNIIFTKIILTGPALRMAGTGVYDKNRDWLTIVLARVRPDSFWSMLPPLPEAVVAEINGPLADPQVQARPFRDISEELKKLFRKRKEDQ